LIISLSWQTCVNSATARDIKINLFLNVYVGWKESSFRYFRRWRFVIHATARANETERSVKPPEINMTDIVGRTWTFRLVSREWRNGKRHYNTKMADAEDEIGRKWDRCFTDAILKFGNYRDRTRLWWRILLFITLLTDFFFSGGGVILGGVFSLFFFKSKMHHSYDIMTVFVIIIVGVNGNIHSGIHT